MKKLAFGNLKDMLRFVCSEIIKNEQSLCELDGFVGDGDHGVTVARGFRAVKKNLDSNCYSTCYEILDMVGNTLSEVMGGAIGPIFGSIFLAAAEVVQDKQDISLADFASMMNEGLKNVIMTGGAKVGDSTLIDALEPAVRQLQKDASLDSNFITAMNNAAQKAHEGALSTKNMIAKKGRARFLGEKSIGYQDAGATTIFIMIDSMKDYCISYHC